MSFEMHCFYGLSFSNIFFMLTPLVILVEWICWLNRQRKRAPTPEELAELEARHERVWQNVARGVNQEESVATEGVRNSKEKEAKKAKDAPESTELTGSRQTFRPGTWQPPT